MPALTAVNIKSSGITDIAFVTLDGATDTFTASVTDHESLILRNPTGGNITCTIIGSDAPAFAFCQGIGVNSVSPESVIVAAGATVVLYLSSIRTKMLGEVTISTGTGLEAALISY